ncbi:MAG: hypothetical protein LUD52_04490 [Opitutae bacterium]|nr:hypothetical protein [Opitutae bacterium]
MRDVSPEQIRVTTIVALCRHHQPCLSPPTLATNPFAQILFARAGQQLRPSTATRKHLA